MITLEYLTHRRINCIMIRGKLSPTVYAAIQNFPGRRYSVTHKSFYVPYSPQRLSTLQTILQQFEEIVMAGMSELNKPIPRVEIPMEYNDKLVRMRYSAATFNNYMIQFRKFLEHIHPKTVQDIQEPVIQEYLLYLVKTKKVSISTQKQAINSIKFYL